MPSPSKTGSGRYMAELPSTDGGYVLLLLAILDQAVRDARMRVRANANGETRNAHSDARLWIKSRAPAFVAYCHMLNLSPDAVMSRVPAKCTCASCGNRARRGARPTERSSLKPGRKISEEARAKMSEALRAYWADPQNRAYMLEQQDKAMRAKQAARREAEHASANDA